MNSAQLVKSPQSSSRITAAAKEILPIREQQQADTEESIQQLFIQRKLSIGAPDDPLEKEADSMAGKVMRMPMPEAIRFSSAKNSVYRKCTHCEEEEKDLQRKESNNDSASVVPPIVHDVLNSSGGKPLDQDTRSFMEPRFNYDFSNVKVHDNEIAAKSARSINAFAYTSGNNIVFNSGQYNTDAESGKRLLAHELTHVVQQGKQDCIQRDLDEEKEFLKRDKPLYMPNPFSSDEEAKKESEDYQAAKKAYGDKLREVAMAPLLRPRADVYGFSNRLRSLTFDQAFILVADDDFFNQVRKFFKGKSLWTIFNILEFNNRIREPFLGLNLAIHADDAQRTADLLSIVITQYNSDRYYAFLKEVVIVVFQNNPLLREIIRLIDHRKDAGISQKLSGPMLSVHYEKNAAGTYELRAFGSDISAYAYVSGNQLRVLVKLRFVDGNDAGNCPLSDAADCLPFSFSGKYSSHYERWKNAMTTYWNNKLSITNGRNTYNVTFVPLIISERDNEASNIRVMTDGTKKCADSLAPGRSNKKCWFHDVEDSSVAHEFGHLVGASDEYNLPGSYKEVKDAGFNLSDEDMRQTTVEGIRGYTKPKIDGGYDIMDSIMNDNTNNVQARHLTRLINLLNKKLPAGVSPFVIHKIK